MSGITIVEVGPRDGLQNEPRAIPVASKVALIDRLSACGFRRIEAASFVSPKWVPQMADGAAVMAAIARRPGTVYSALTPNLKGYEAARAAGADEVAIFGAASETFSRRNINASIAESLERFRPVADAARADGLPLRGYVSCVVVCPYEGAIAPEAVARVTEALFAMGCHEVSLGDTVGRGTPESIGAMLDAVLSVAPAERLAGHYHDTNGRALESVAVSVARGLRVFDSAIGGLGGCPYAPGAKGNLSTMKLANWCAENGHRTGLDMEGLAAAERFVAELRRDLDALPDDPA
ncbi:hydroxymethylglutaryl-CoA lyase [Limibaculum sp. FT325]|uniref:hydroxymethylglutaryl-CoA lyase n=1 Tax=Thermohalobaculum sediminis TaxID=2939436 RepID=UPI0020C036BA|nr:hydroxymethylglutaryl-CoA lyase [Limibaculum sediminis]MCL5775414.1 hydroxymethylglutaryl-CoA lyase [Limibaculum sediminis]